MVASWNPFILFYFKSTNFTSFTFSIQQEFSQNQPAAITLNTGSPRTLLRLNTCGHLRPTTLNMLFSVWYTKYHEPNESKQHEMQTQTLSINYGNMWELHARIQC